jgi:crotonobetainyl-CoA:carnitine CoA-transferase CaiB-like acyl-CoA transferase
LYRRTGPFARGVAGVERGAYFAVSNHSKRSFAVDVAAEPDAASWLADQSDVVLENFGSKRMTRLGVDADARMTARPETLYVSLSGFGQSGPLASYRAYANNVHAYGGLSLLTRNENGELLHVGSVLADPLASLTAATVIAAWALSPDRPGGVVDLSMAEVVADKLSEFITEAALGENRTIPTGCDRYPFAPHGIHPTADERWIALEVHSDSEWARLVDVLGRPPELGHPAWSRAAERWQARRSIQSALDRITSESRADDLFHRLQGAGIRACPVWTGAQLIEDRHLAERAFFPVIDHPEPDLAGSRIVGLAWRFVGEGAIPLGPPPSLGNYTRGEASP